MNAVPKILLGGRPKPKAVEADFVSDDRRPTIQFIPSRFEANVYASVDALRAAGDTYKNSSKLVRVLCATQYEQDASGWVDSDGHTKHETIVGAPMIAPITTAVLRMRLSEVANYRKWAKARETWVECSPPDEIVGAVADLGDWDLPVLRGLVETPIMRADGSIAEARGYDAQSGYWLAPSAQFPAVPATPSQAQAERAYAELAEVFADFPYASREESAVPIATILTTIAKTRERPGFLFDAPQGGVGKTLQTDAIAVIATGRPASRAAYPASDEETGKVLASYARRGSQLISIDDIKRTLGGENLDRVLTARGEVDFRVLGRTELVTAPWSATLMFTGVNVGLLGQMGRRLLRARIVSTLERPQDRANFQHHPLLDWVLVERPRLVRAALTLLRAYVVAGQPDMDLPAWGSFESWARLIPHAIVYAGGPSVLDARIEDDEESADVAHLPGLLTGLLDLCAERAPRLGRRPEDGLGAGEILEAIKGEGDSELRVALRTMTGTKAADPNAVQVGVALARDKDRPFRVGDRLLRLVKAKRERACGQRWTVEVIR